MMRDKDTRALTINKTASRILVLVFSVLILGLVGGPHPLAHGDSMLALDASSLAVGANAEEMGVTSASSVAASNMEFVGQIGGKVRTVAISGTLAYAGQGADLVVLDVSDPAVPRIAGETRTPLAALIEDVAVLGDVVYAVGRDGLHLIDVSDPGNLNEIGFLATAGEAAGVAIKESYAYVVCSSPTGGLIVVDVSDPSNLSEAGSYPIRATNVVIEGNYAYAAGGDLYIVDISTPSNPTQGGGRICLCRRLLWKRPHSGCPRSNPAH